MIAENITIFSFSTQELHPHIECPYYIHGSNVPTREKQIHYLINHFQCKYIGIIHVDKNSNLDRKAHNLWNELLKDKTNICMVKEIFTGLNKTKMMEVLSKIEADEILDIIILSDNLPAFY